MLPASSGDYRSSDSSNGPGARDSSEFSRPGYSGSAASRHGETSPRSDRIAHIRDTYSSSFRESSSSRWQSSDETRDSQTASRTGYSGDYHSRYDKDTESTGRYSSSAGSSGPTDRSYRGSQESERIRSSAGPYERRSDDRPSYSSYSGNRTNGDTYRSSYSLSYSHAGSDRRDDKSMQHSPSVSFSRSRAPYSSTSTATSSGIPPDIYSQGTATQRGDNYSNLRASEAVFHGSSSSDLSASSSSYHGRNGSAHSSRYDGSYDYNEYSISRETTQPLEGYSASTTVSYATIPASTTHEPATESINAALIATLRGSLEITSSFSSADHSAFRSAIDASIAALNSLSSLEPQIAKSRSAHTALQQQIAKDEVSLAKHYVEYLMAEQQVRVIEADLAESKRVIHDLEQTNGDWAETNWSLVPFHSEID